MKKSVVLIASVFIISLSLMSCYKEVTCATYTHDVEQPKENSNN